MASTCCRRADLALALALLAGCTQPAPPQASAPSQTAAVPPASAAPAASAPAEAPASDACPPLPAGPLLDALGRADKDERARLLDTLRDRVGGQGLVLAMGSVQKEPYEINKHQTQQLFNMLRLLADPRAADGLVKYLESKPPHPHFVTEAAIRLAEVGDVRAAKYLGERLKMDPLQIYDRQKDPELVRDDLERVVSARMLADLAVLHPEALKDLLAAAEEGALFWSHDRPQPHANALRFLVAAGSTKVMPDLRTWANPSAPLPKEGAMPPFPVEFETAITALRYLGAARDPGSWSLLETQLTRRQGNEDLSQEALLTAGRAMRGMAVRGLAVGAAQGFAQWGDKRAFTLLLKTAKDEKQNEGAREEACHALAWVADSGALPKMFDEIKASAGKNAKKELLRRCLLEAIGRRPAPASAPELLALLPDPAAAVALGKVGFDEATEKALLGRLREPAMTQSAAVALLLGGSEEAAARVAAASPQPPDGLPDLYGASFDFVSDGDLSSARLLRWVRNAEALAAAGAPWARERLARRLGELQYDNGPRSMTRVVLRYRLIDLARKGDAPTKKGAIETLKLMKEQGSLMALRDEKGDTGDLARRALSALLGPRCGAGEPAKEGERP